MLDTFFARPRRVFGAIAVICAAMLAFGILYLQNVVGLEPCPMCIVQRYALIAVALTAAVAAAAGAGLRRALAWLAIVLALAGAAVAAVRSMAVAARAGRSCRAALSGLDFWRPSGYGPSPRSTR